MQSACVLNPGSFLIIFILDLISGNPALPSTQFYKMEEYHIEHSISTEQAKNAVQSLDPKNFTPKPGCKECTQEEIRYCLGSKLINDHCCCDKRYKENFPYIPHTCYLGEKLCEPLAKDCAVYSRLRDCCCDRYALEKWKMKSSGTKVTKTSLANLFFLTTTIYLFFEYR